VAQATITEGLAQVDLFSGLSHRDLARIARSGREVDHKPGKEVVTQGRGGIAFHLVLGGSAGLEIGGQLRKRLGAGDYFGEISLLDEKPRTATVRAGGDGLRTFAITAWEFQALLKEQPQIARALLITLCARIRDTQAASDAAR